MGHLHETAWDKNKWDGLKDKKKGPKSKSKRTEKLEKRISRVANVTDQCLAVFAGLGKMSDPSFFHNFLDKLDFRSYIN